MLQKLSEKTLEIINNISVLKRLCAKFQLIGYVTKETLDKLGIPLDTNMKGEITDFLSRATYAPKQRAQVLSIEVHTLNIKD